MDMLESIRHGAARIISLRPGGVLIENTDCGDFMMSAVDREAADFLLSRGEKEVRGAVERVRAATGGPPLFAVHQSFFVERVKELCGYKESLDCFQAAYLESLPPRFWEGADIRRLDASRLPFIMEHYRRADEEYQRERLEAGVMFGAFVGGELAGFIGLHGEGSIGMLEILPRYRRKGIALALESFMVRRLLLSGRVPFAQIIVGNAPSKALHEKLGFTVTDQVLHWLY